MLSASRTTSAIGTCSLLAKCATTWYVLSANLTLNPLIPHFPYPITSCGQPYPYRTSPEVVPICWDFRRNRHMNLTPMHPRDGCPTQHGTSDPSAPGCWHPHFSPLWTLGWHQ